MPSGKAAGRQHQGAGRRGGDRRRSPISALQVKALVDEVSVASRQQAQGIDQVTQAIAQMEKVTQTTAATAEESAAASEELNAEAAVSRQFVEQLEMMMGADRPSVSARPATGATAASAARVVPLALARKSRQRPEPAEFLETGTFGRF